MPNAVKIKLTSIISPSEFYFKYLESNHDDHKRIIANNEKNISNYRGNEIKFENVEFGKVYGCYHTVWHKWVRGRAVKRLRNGCNAYLIDHGFFKNFERLIEIPQELQIPIKNNIQKGSLAIKNEEWNEKIIAICKSLNSVKHDVEINLITIYKDEKEDIHFGDLFVIDGNDRYSLTDKLISNGCVSKCQTFNEIYSTLSKDTSDNHQRPRQKLSTFSNSTSSCSSSLVKSQIPSCNLILHGQNLKSSWKTTDDFQFDNFFKHQISKKCPTLSEIQSNVWPQVNDDKNVIVITTNQDDLTSSYLVPLLNKMMINPMLNTNSKHMGPIAIIFAQNSQKVNEIKKLCNEYGNNKVQTITAIGICEDKKVDLITGCELLIITPPAFIRLTRNISVNLIDENRLKHVVFDNFYEMSQKFDSLINSCVQFFLQFSKRPQMIVTSSAITNEMKYKIINNLEKSKTVLCIDNYLEAAAVCAGMTLSFEITTSLEQKLEIISKYPKKSTIIAVSDDRTDSQLNEHTFINDSQISVNASNNINHLIHFDIPSSWNKFLKRFEVFKILIYNRLNANDKSDALKTTIFLNEDNTSEFESLLMFLETRNLLTPSCESIIKKIQMNQERVKCMKDIELCSRLLQFGKCDKIFCTNRHILRCDQDKPLNHLPPIRSLIKFDLISVQNPTNFVIRIREHLENNNKWISRDDDNKVVQQQLNVDMQNSCTVNKCYLKMKEAKIGEIYAKYDDKMTKFVRSKIIERVNHQIVKLYLIDYGITSLCLEIKLIKLSEEYRKLNPQICKLQICDLIPLDGENYYEDASTENLKNVIEKLPTSVIFICQIHAIIADTIFAENFEGRCNASVKFQLKNIHMKMKISEIDKNVSQKINELTSKIKINEEPVMPMKKQEYSTQLHDDSMKQNKVINWKQLDCGRKYSINIQHYLSPYSFFVILYDPNNLTLRDALKAIEEEKVDEVLKRYDAGTCCLYRDDNSNRQKRAIILSSNENDSCEILFADYGEIVTCKKENLFDIPAKFLNLNFQTVHCSMAKVKPKFSMNVWPVKQREAIKALIDEFEKSSLNMRVIKNDLRENKFNEIGIKCYNVFLYDNSSKRHLYKIAIERKIADVCDDDDSLKDLEYIDTDSDGSDYDDDDDIGDEEDDDENDSMEIICKTDSGNFSEKSKSNYCDSNQSESSESKMSLKYMHKQINIEWRQNNFMVYLLISARDCKQYSLKIQESSIDIIMENSNEFQRSIVQLYGLINTEICSHEMNGANIIIRLVKKTLNIWPRLMEQNEKSQYIKYSNENVPLFHISQCFRNKESTKTKLNIAPVDSDNDDDENSDDEQFVQSSSDEDY